MQKGRISVILAILAVLILSGVSQAEIVKVAKRYNVFEVYGGLSEPIGKYEGVGILDFDYNGHTYKLDADQVYRSTYHFGFNFGQLRGGHFQYLVGFQYTKIDQLDEFSTTELTWQMAPIPFINQYNIKAQANYLFTDLADVGFAPYLGPEFMAGLTTETANDVQTETQLDISLAANAGFELKLWGDASGQNFITLVPQVSWQFLSTGYRAKHFNFAGGLKYYFR
ncbi:MAG TPA: hypothetical protein PLF13_08045 [candidate division Zixibacteria bacterium]|nr:hypothetical protein [candidate division Zixibacteria bacterium]